MNPKFFTFLLLACLVACLCLPVQTQASTYAASESYSQLADETLEGNAYIAGNTVTLPGMITGDTITAGNTVTLSGTYQDDVIAAGATVTFSGKASDDVRIIGSQVIISGTIAGDLNVAAATVTIDANAKIDGDVSIAASLIDLSGVIGGTFAATSQTLTINSQIGKGVDVRVETLTLGEKTSIGGNLHYRAPEQATIHESATIGGTTTFTQLPDKRFSAYGGLMSITLTAFLLQLVGSIVVVLTLLFVLKKFSTAITTYGIQHIWQMALWGIIALIITPIVSILLFITMIGAPIALLLLVLYIAFLVIASAFGSMLIGSLVYKYLGRKDTVVLTWQTAILGVLLMEALFLVPIIGWLIAGIFFVAALGATLKTLHTTLTQ